MLLVLWAGSLWSLSWVTSVLFYAQDDRHLAGLLAGQLFSIEAYVGVAVAALAFLLTKVPGRTEPLPRPFVGGYVAAALLAANEWALRPVMAMARARGTMAGLSFGAWHGVSTVIYGLACIAVLRLIWKDDFR
ncbi:MAG: DUF4149 domain-containing protein [Pseudomonadota bacterium]|nr:DUF4149 domain-containing protein [Pseudomonadota bacterium]